MPKQTSFESHMPSTLRQQWMLNQARIRVCTDAEQEVPEQLITEMNELGHAIDALDINPPPPPGGWEAGRKRWVKAIKTGKITPTHPGLMR